MQTTTIDHQALRQRFNPDGSQLRKHQLRMLEILVVIDKICRKHQIPYWLSSGTLIGAVRHNGFIPWDDDLDIEMMRNDYLHLLEVLTKELPDWLALQTDETDPNYFFFYAKVRDRRSVLNEGNNYDRMWKEKGIYIDIFPMEEHPIWLHKLTELSVGHMYKVWRKSKDDAKAIKRVRRIFNFNNRYVFPFLRRFLPSHDSSTQSPPPYGGARGGSSLHTPHSTLLTSGMGIPYHNPRFAEDIFPLAEHVFEGYQFPVPHDYDHHLRSIYGDYTKLPDLDAIHPHVNHIEIYD